MRRWLTVIGLSAFDGIDRNGILAVATLINAHRENCKQMDALRLKIGAVCGRNYRYHRLMTLDFYLQTTDNERCTLRSVSMVFR
jgi:coenzyme F420-reducing hydrogenase beta subunit